MNINDLNKRITFQKRTIATNENGYEQETWPDFATVWASVSNLFGREYYEAMQVQAENTVKFAVRYLEGINTEMRIIFNKKYYNIIFIDNIKYNNTFLEIKAVEEAL